MTRLVLVESPAKCSKIQSFLGDGWRVLATMGHIRALAEKLDAVGIENGWTPTYQELPTKKDQIAKLKKAAKEASEIWLATDDDREGEGIAWHVCQILKLSPATTPRIVFHEITRPAIQAAVAAPRRLDLHRVNAYQARTMLDMLVGFTISRVLWKRVAPRLSAGRCQTPALRLVAERDAEIAGHTARGYWTLHGVLGHPTLTLDPLGMKATGEWTEAEARALLTTAKGLSSTAVTVTAVKERVAVASPPPPLITSTLQQEASALHGLGPKQTMHAAQKLYEAGHITYMRTDNPCLSEEAATAVRALVRERWGDEYVGVAAVTATATVTATGSSGPPDVATAAAAHEAIRPTHPEIAHLPDVEPSQQVVYRLIWRRAVQSQMAAARTDVRQCNLCVESMTGVNWATEQTKDAFLGWRCVERTEKTEATAAVAAHQWTTWTPHLVVGAILAWQSLGADEIFTKPPGRFTEATLVRELERKGIGRPSTFASLVSTLFDREYVEKTNCEGFLLESRHLLVRTGTRRTLTESKQTHKTGAEKNKIRATPLGVSVVACLEKDFQDLFAYAFTATMESGLDQIAAGSKAWKSILQETWDTYKDRYAAALAEKDARVQSTSNTGVKIVQTKRGPLLVRPAADGTGDVFAPVPAGMTAATATPEAVEAAFATAIAAKEGEAVGTWGDAPMRKKKGPYGWYVEAEGVRVPWKPEDTADTLCQKLEAKRGAFERVVGPFHIKQGPYGLYFYRAAAKGKKPTFIKFPADKDPATITEADLTACAAAPPPTKRRPVGKKAAAKSDMTD